MQNKPLDQQTIVVLIKRMSIIVRLTNISICVCTIDSSEALALLLTLTYEFLEHLPYSYCVSGRTIPALLAIKE